MATTSKRSAGDEPDENNSNKKAKPDGQEPSRHCCLCFKTEQDDDQENFLLPSHKCPTCVSGAWDICEACDDSLLSRQCPICRKNYAPRILFRSPQIISAEQILGQDSTRNPSFAISQLAMSNVVLSRQIVILAQLIISSNVAVYFDNRLHFYLPESAILTVVEAEFRTLCASIPFDGTFDAEGRYLFTNDTWDALENEIEGEGDVEEEGEDDGEGEDEGEEGGEDSTEENEEVVEVEDAPASDPVNAAAVEQEGNHPPVVAVQATDETDGNVAVVAAGEGGLANGVKLTAKEALKSIFLLLLRGGSLFTQMEPTQWEVLTADATVD